MNAIRKQLDKIKPAFEKGGKLEAFHTAFDAFETFLFVPNTRRNKGVHVHDAMDSKRAMTMVLIALMPALLFGMYNLGYQHYLAMEGGAATTFFDKFIYGLLSMLPQIIVAYTVGLGIEFVIASKKGEEVAEGFLVTGMLIPMIVPVETPLWMIAVATAFSVVFAKEVFGGTGYNIVNVALITRATLFFSYPAAMSGDSVWVRLTDTFGLGAGKVVDGFSGATPLGMVASTKAGTPVITDTLGNVLTMSQSLWDSFIGLIPGSIGETSKLAIIFGALFLIWTGVASYKIMVSGVAGLTVMALVFNAFGTTPAMMVTPLQHMLYGGFAFGIVFMATDPVTAARTEVGKWIYGFLIGVMVVFIRVMNLGFAEGMMLAILFMNVFAPLIDYVVVDRNVQRRLKRAKKVKTA